MQRGKRRRKKRRRRNREGERWQCRRRRKKAARRERGGGREILREMVRKREKEKETQVHEQWKKFLPSARTREIETQRLTASVLGGLPAALADHRPPFVLFFIVSTVTLYPPVTLYPAIHIIVSISSRVAFSAPSKRHILRSLQRQ